MAEAVAAEPRPKTRGPFIMPDGRPLSVFIESQQLRPSRGGSGSGQRRRPGAIKEPKEGWTKALPRAATATAATEAAGRGPMSEAEAAELYALSRVGHRKQRRWLNDKLLRDMAGTLTAADMASLFKPVPFGEQRTSLWEQAAQPQHAVLWDLFRSLDMDKQSRVLQKWEAHVRELQAGPAAIQNPAIHALAAWAGVSWKARQAMKRARTSMVEGIEAQILAWLQQGEDSCGQELVVEGLEDGFQRLIAHGLAEYHSLSSHSRLTADGGKEVVVRRRAAGAASAPEAHAPASPPPARRGDEGEGSEAGMAAAEHGSPAGGRLPRRVLEISCCDILHVLVDERDQPLSAAVLQQAYLHPLDSSSEAGDHRAERLERHLHDTQQQQQQSDERLVAA